MTSTEITPAGGRPTRQRVAVAAVMETFDDFRSAQDIYALLAQRGDHVGLSTVYRTLQHLADAGTIARPPDGGDGGEGGDSGDSGDGGGHP